MFAVSASAQRVAVICFCVGIQGLLGLEFRTPSGLENDDLIEWSGTVSARRAKAFMFIKTDKPSERYFQLQIHGARFRLWISNVPTRVHSRLRACVLGRTTLYPRARFRIIVRVHQSSYRVYLNGVLKYTLADSVHPYDIRKVQVFGAAKTDTFRLLSIEHMSSQLNHPKCGKSNPLSNPSVPEGCLQLSQTSVNAPVAMRITGGAPASPGALPWQAAIRRKGAYAGRYPHQCGATLIGRCWAISAAHCFPSTRSKTLNRLVVRVGDYYNADGPYNDAEMGEFEHAQDLPIYRVYKHEDYTSLPTARQDIALIHLRKCATLSRFVQPVCLPSSHQQFGAGDTCGISGWGATNHSQLQFEHPHCLQNAEVSIKEPQRCARAYRENYLNNIMFCASESQVDTCQGDSGGPIVCERNDTFTLWGITSWGVGCGDVEHPGVYTRLASFVKWLYLKMAVKPNDDLLQIRMRGGQLPAQYCQHEQSDSP